MKDREKVLRQAPILAEQMQQHKPGEWFLICGFSDKKLAEREAEWIVNNFGCATRLKYDRLMGEWNVEVKKAKLQVTPT